MLSLIPIGIPANALSLVIPLISMAFAISIAFSSFKVMKASMSFSVSLMRAKVSLVKSVAVISFETNRLCNSSIDLSYNFSIMHQPLRCQ